MPDPGSHKYDIKRTRRRNDYESEGVPDQHADDAANRDLQRAYPPRQPEGRGAPEAPAGAPGAKGREKDVEGGGIRLRSRTFNDHDLLPRRCSRDGENIAPALEWSQVPDDAVELALLCEDPDAPTGTFLHWMVSNIPPRTGGLGDGDMPDEAVESRNGFERYGWDGPQPPVGDEPHRYFFRLFASRQPLRLGRDSGPEDLHAALEGVELASGNIVGLFQR